MDEAQHPRDHEDSNVEQERRLCRPWPHMGVPQVVAVMTRELPTTGLSTIVAREPSLAGVAILVHRDGKQFVDQYRLVGGLAQDCPEPIFEELKAP